MQNSPTGPAAVNPFPPPWMTASVSKLSHELATKYGDSQRGRIQRGLHQVAAFWRAEDGDHVAFEDFVRTGFAGDQSTLNAIFDRLERALEQLGGHMHEISREFRQQLDLDLGPVLPLDEISAGTIPRRTWWMTSFTTNLPLSCC